jgi:hypothetical protein
MNDGALQAEALLAAWAFITKRGKTRRQPIVSTPEAWRIDEPKNYRALMYQPARGFWEFAMEIFDSYRAH